MTFTYEEDDDTDPLEPREPTLAGRVAAVRDVVTPFDMDIREDTDGMLGAQITRWRDMPRDDAPAAWGQLRDFVDWLVDRYDLSASTIPPCWYRHPVLVEELSALRAAWDASFIVETDGGLGPIGWHERFALTRARIREYGYNGDCRSGHKEPPARTLTVDENDWDHWRRTP